MQYTDQYHLNQWELSDRILHTDFNNDNVKTEAAILEAKQSGYVKLKEIITTANAQQIDVDVTNIDWDSYRQVEICFEATGTAAYYGSVRLNGLAATNDYKYQDSSNNYYDSSTLCALTMNYGGTRQWTKITLFCRTSQINGFYDIAGGSNYGCRFYAKNLGFDNLTAINFLAGLGQIAAGAKITFYGVRV